MDGCINIAVRSIIFYLLNLLNALAQTVFGVGLKGSITAVWGSWYFWGLLGTSVFGATSAWWQKRKVEQQQIKYKVLMDDQLEPLVRLLIKISAANAAGRRDEFMNFIKTATVMAAGIVPSDKTRASIFEVINPSPQQDTTLSAPYLKPMEGSETGRGDRPKSIFHKDHGEGKEVWKNMLGQGYCFCTDTHSEKNLPPGWNADRERHYRSFISVSIESGDKFYGMLTVNTPEVNKLKEEDINSMQVVAGLVATAMNLSKRKNSNFYMVRSR